MSINFFTVVRIFKSKFVEQACRLFQLKCSRVKMEIYPSFFSSTKSFALSAIQRRLSTHSVFHFFLMGPPLSPDSLLAATADTWCETIQNNFSALDWMLQNNKRFQTFRLFGLRAPSVLSYSCLPTTCRWRRVASTFWPGEIVLSIGRCFFEVHWTLIVLCVCVCVGECVCMCVWVYVWVSVCEWAREYFKAFLWPIWVKNCLIV